MASLEMKRFTFERSLMGTRFVVICYTAEHEVARDAADRAFFQAEQLNTIASDYLPGSELSLLSTQPPNTSIPLSPQFFALLMHARSLAEATDGAFDPTLGLFTKLWRESREQGRLPALEKLRAARNASGWQHFTLSLNTNSIILHRKNMAFDLGGIAKGYAADVMLESLAKDGIHSALIAAGGDIRLGNPPPGRSGWRVALQTFDPIAPDEIRILANAAVSTSGDLYQSIDIDGVQYSHLIDPQTGLGLTHRIAASVIADEAKVSDPIATAACVRGLDGADAIRKLPHVRELILRIPKPSHPTALSQNRLMQTTTTGISNE